jgi:hypothetical protein
LHENSKKIKPTTIACGEKPRKINDFLSASDFQVHRQKSQRLSGMPRKICRYPEKPKENDLNGNKWG